MTRLFHFANQETVQPGGFPSAYTETTLSAKPSERLVDAPMSDPFEAKSVPSFQPDTLAAETNYNCLRIQNLLCSVEKKDTVSN